MLDIHETEEKKARVLALAKIDESLAVVCAKIVSMAVSATQTQLSSALHLSCRVADDNIFELMKSVGLSSDDMVVVVNSHHFKAFKACGFVLGPMSHACNIFLSKHLERWVDGYQIE